MRKLIKSRGDHRPIGIIYRNLLVGQKNTPVRWRERDKEYN